MKQKLVLRFPAAVVSSPSFIFGEEYNVVANVKSKH